jgi:UDP-glucuronate decarboxylase
VVTGGAGFLGSHLCERLLADGREVVALDNFLTGRPHNVEHLLENDRFRLVKADVTDYIHVPGPVDHVLHFASPASPIDYLQLPIETLKVGSAGTLHALGLAKEKGARFLLASTSEAYGDPQVHPQPETYWGHVNPVGPRGVYDEAKRYAEALTMAYRRTHDVDTGIVRIFNSVLADEQLLYDDGEQLHRTTAHELAERLGQPCTALGGWTVPAFDEQRELGPSEASWFVGHPTDATCYEVTTRYGRTIRVTGDHSLFVRGSAGLPAPKPVRDLVVGEKIAIAGRVNVTERDRAVVDMLDVVRHLDPWSIAVSFDGVSELVHEHRLEMLTAHVARRAGRTRQSAYGVIVRWRRDGYVPLGALQACGLRVPGDALLSKGGKYRLPRFVVLTDEMLWLFGLWVAEGSAVFTPPKSYYLSIACDEETLDRAEKIATRDLGIHCSRLVKTPARSGCLALNGFLLLELFRHLGWKSNEKRLPGWVLGLPLRRLGHLLEGYREGDGVHSGLKFDKGVRHEFSTTSEALKNDLVVAFSRFGLVPSIGRYETTFRQKTGDRRYPFWRLTLCAVSPWSPLDWHRGVTQRLQAPRDGDLVWAIVTSIKTVPATPLVYDFTVPGKENFWAGTGVLAHNTHGPRMRPNDGRAIPAFASQALTGKPITVAGDGSQTRSVIYVDDLIEGVVRLLRSDHPGPMNIGNPHEVSVLELAETIKRLTGSDSEIVFIPRPTDDPTVRQPDISLARRELGWEPKVPFEDGLRRTIEWFRSHPDITTA